MPRTADEIARTDRLAEDIGYVPPPEWLEPQVPQDFTFWWSAMCDLWADASINWHDALLVHLSRRFDISIETAYHATDNFAKAELRRRDEASDPEAHNGYGN